MATIDKEVLNTLEPTVAQNNCGADVALFVASIAISAKRIADQLERLNKNLEAVSDSLARIALRL